MGVVWFGPPVQQTGPKRRFYWGSTHSCLPSVWRRRPSFAAPCLEPRRRNSTSPCLESRRWKPGTRRRAPPLLALSRAVGTPPLLALSRAAGSLEPDIELRRSLP
ncbi:hypothetical protein BDA96_08G161900 [Sorghum bicolor]|uniref:Uncharacterized protein n=2 Tax=Sorghum bicolor TaxID=4558 RepID=A0A921U8K1_SORBI|nr:hypothetical protein BDA96_08G161900 [Sorghum bicolor]OQU79451.1 hypothetical protein SORBI_3008G146301 [Sorghum bicolor]